LKTEGGSKCQSGKKNSRKFIQDSVSAFIREMQLNAALIIKNSWQSGDQLMAS